MSYAQQVDLVVVWQIIVRARRLLAVAAVAFLCAGLLAASFLQDRYTAEAVLAPHPSGGGGDLMSLAGLGDVSGFAGMLLGGTSGAEAEIAVGMELLESRRLFDRFVARPDILVHLFAVDRYDRSEQQLLLDSDEYDAVTGQWVREPNLLQRALPDPLWTVTPSTAEAFAEFRGHLLVQHESQTGFVRVRVEHASPEVARDWIIWLVADLNRILRDEDIDEAQRAVDYLALQAETTALAGLRQVFFELIEEQTKKIMLANVRQEYAFRTISPPVAPRYPSGTPRVLIALGGASAAWLIVCALVIARGHMRMRVAEAPV